MGTRWASNTGSTIIGSLNIDTIAWTTGTTVRYTFSGSPDLSSVVVGHQLQATGCTNALHNGTFEITAVSNASDYIDVTNTAITDASNDEAASPGTGTAKSDASIVQEPTSAKQALGWLNGEKPPAGYFNWLAANGGRVQVATADIGRSTIASSSYTAIGGEGYTVCPTKSSSAWGSTVGASSATDVTGSGITPRTTASNRILVGSAFSADYAGTDNSGRTVLAVNGSTLSGNGNVALLPIENASISQFHLITSATGGNESYKQQAYTSGGVTNIVTTNGRTWACEFASTVAAGTVTDNSGLISTTSTSFVDLTGASITISPTTNPVLLMFSGNARHGDAAYTNEWRFYDGSTAYGDWLNRYFDGTTASSRSSTIAWLTGDLNGSTTFKVQHKSVTGDSVGVENYRFSAIEITGDAKSAKPTGTCAVVDAEATITDGSTPLSHAFTPGANINYLAVLTCYSERTAGTGYLILRVKVNGTEIIKIDHARDSASNYKSPITIAIPTGLLTSGVAQTIIATAETSDVSTTYDLKSAALFLVEAPVLTASESGDPAEVELTNVSPGRTRVDWSSQRVCSADVALSYALYENVNAGGAVEVFSKTLTAPGTADQDCSISWLRPTDLAAGDDVVYDVRAKMASGNVIFPAGYLSVSEVPNV